MKKIEILALAVVGLILAGGGILALLEKPSELPAQKTDYRRAPELAGIHAYINADNITIASQRGKVVLVDFWTYTCINCIRTLPYLKSWHEQYGSDGLVIIGVHTPEFNFEKELPNVKRAVEKYGIGYPVALDNDYQTWRAYRNSYWPRKYLIDADGYIRYDHIGEGAYEETEQMIKQLLTERAARLKGSKPSTGMSSPAAAEVDYSKIQTPELYFGYGFIRSPLGNPEGYSPENTITYGIPERIEPNMAYLQGQWQSSRDFMELAGESGRMVLRYSAKSVNIVAGSDNTAVLRVTLDSRQAAGADLTYGQALVDEFRLYNIADSSYGEHTISIDITGKGFKVYTFTFG